MFKLFLNPPFEINKEDYSALWFLRHEKKDTLLIDDIKEFINKNKAKDPTKLQNFIETFECLKALSIDENLRTVVLSAAQKTGENAGGAVPMTFHVEKSTFRADGHARRGKAVTINPRTCKSCPGAPPGP